MQYRKDKYGNDLSILGFGCMRFTRKGPVIDIDKAEKEIMAAYNAGDGRIQQCIRHAEARGIDASYWDNVTSLFEEMKGFSGRETVAFVDGVLETWRKYCRFYQP